MIVNRQTLAELFNVKGDTLDRWVEIGLPVERRGRRREWQADLGPCIAWLVEKTRADATSSGPGSEVSVQRERLLRAQAEAKETANRVRAGELIERAPAAAEVLEGVIVARDRLLTIPSRVAPRVAAMADIEQIEVLLTAEMEQEMTLLSQRAEAL